MKASELRQSILQAAVQGKLVPQNADDEPASELLKRIRQEKARLVKEGKIKKEKLLPTITEDEFPYDLPDGWVWCRLIDVTNSVDYGTSTKTHSDQNGVPVLRMNNIQNGSVNFDNLKYTFESNINLPFLYLSNGDLLFNRTNSFELVGKSAVFQNENNKYSFASYLIRVSFIGINSCYISYFINSDSCRKGQIEPNATQQNGQANFSGSKLKAIIIPLPSLAEQQRIVAKVDELMALCDELEAAEKELDALETHFAEYLPKSILQAAVQGKLVPQKVHDEPASKLLKRIRQEKARLVKEGKIKKEKPLPPITEDEIPYDLPDGWVWCRIGDIIRLTENDNIQNNYSLDTFINYVDIDSIDNKKYKIKEAKVLSVKQLSSRARRVIKKDYILYSLVRPYLNNIAIVEDEKENYIGSTGFVVFKPVYTQNLYFMAVLLCPYIEAYFLSLLSGFNSPSVSQKNFLNTLFPLPPLAEQKRIVAKVDELMALCEELKNARNVAAKPAAANIVPLQPKEERDELLIAARGDASQGLSDKAQHDADELLGD